MKDAIRYEVYKAADGWRWRGKRNGRITSESGEGYKRWESCEKSLRAMLTTISDGRYEIIGRQDNHTAVHAGD